VTQKVKLSILGISYTQVQVGAYALIFAEENGVRRLPIVIGAPETQSIAIAMEGMKPPRPLSHDLMFAIFKELKIELTEVLIYKFEDGAFFAELLLQQDEKVFRFDSRTSDAIALALRTNSPIYTTEEIMQNMAIVFDEDIPISQDFAEDDNPPNRLPEFPTETLLRWLDDALNKEQYEVAIRLRDELNRRKTDD
jgi:bifunctional DNase/RNase